MPIVNVIARFAVRPDSLQSFEDAIAHARPEMLADPGCLRYDLQRVRKSDSAYVLLEAYDSSDALRRHGELEAFRKLGVALADLLLAKPDVLILDPVGHQVARA